MGFCHRNAQSGSRDEDHQQGGASHHGEMVSERFIMQNSPASPDDAIEITLDVNTRIQILDELSHLAGARKHQFAAFCRREGCLVVWADEVETLIPSAEALELRMMAFIWYGRHEELAVLEAEAKEAEEGWLDQDAEFERRLRDAEDLKTTEEKIGAKPGDWEMRDIRPVMLYAPLISGFAMILTFVFIGSGMGNLIKEALLDGSWLRLALLSTSPFGYLLAIVSHLLLELR